MARRLRGAVAGPGWHAVILGKGGYLDEIFAAGFEGVRLDKIDFSVLTIRA